MKTIHIIVADKVATARQRDGVIVCGNGDYQIKFVFDSEWPADTPKTARFIWDGQYVDVEITDDVCRVPIISNTLSVSVGVYTEELSTTTPATIECKKSILCLGGEASDGMREQYADEAKLAADRAEAAADRAEEAVERGDSGVYVGSGDMPEDCNVQIDVDGDVIDLEDIKAEVTPVKGVDYFDGKDGITPHIGENGNWWIGEEDKGVRADGSGNGAPSDWNANEGEDGHILNRTHWKEVIPGGDEIYSGNSSEWTVPDGLEMLAIQNDALSTISEGRSYTVTWNGTSYKCVAFDAGENGILLGNLNAVGVTQTGEEPFLIACMPADMAAVVGFNAAVLPLDDSADIALTIVEGEREIYHKIPKEYIPTPIVVKSSGDKANYTSTEIVNFINDGIPVFLIKEGDSPVLHQYTTYMYYSEFSDYFAVFVSHSDKINSNVAILIDKDGNAKETLWTPFLYSLEIHGTIYNGSYRVNMTPAIRTIVQEELGVIENGSY